MPRLRQLGRPELTDDFTRRTYDRIFGERDPVAEPGAGGSTTGDWWTVFAGSPAVLRHAVGGFALYQSADRRLPPRLRELAQARAGWAAGSQFVFSQHCKALRATGATEEQVASVPSWSTADCFDPPERAVLAYADCLVLAHGRVPDDLFERLRDHLDDEQILELTYVTGTYLLHAVAARALRLEFDDRPDPVVEVDPPSGP